jgi:hypothetical protein
MHNNPVILLKGGEKLNKNLASNPFTSPRITKGNR